MLVVLSTTGRINRALMLGILSDVIHHDMSRYLGLSSRAVGLVAPHCTLCTSVPPSTHLGQRVGLVRVGGCAVSRGALSAAAW